jgi:hypothetical protein
LLGIFYYTLYRLSLVIVPASKPEDKVEEHQRFLVFCSYVWGLQMPLWNTSSANAREVEKRIDGSHSFIRFPGMIRLQTHQIIGISNKNILHVEGPGIVFTKKGDYPHDIMDLRNQMRECTIHAFSREGIPLLAKISVTFSIDDRVWSPILFPGINSANPSYKYWNYFRRTVGQAFPYSAARAEAALNLQSKCSCPGGKTERWDDYALGIMEKAARETLVERGINDLWRARKDEKSNAFKGISGKIIYMIESHLYTKGIKLIKSNISGFVFPDHRNQEMTDNEGEQQIAAWNVERERKIRIAHADVLARAKRIEEEARMNARSLLLTAIMEGLKQASRHHPQKDSDAFSQVYLDLLKSMIDQHLDLSYKSETVDDLKKNRDDNSHNR